ncbi:hypothetical protein UCRNP2_9566 [Neofusicoccum parvum UCRNP2]|uniref:Uncharacterized protein n=2 Tax=Neofusicoccum parvum TaxID=310453 RepID=R1FX47_BOTPV|nr:hypothetical protein UCRNP2_9566 [Neofusicoccum parvum UCRNP2]GME42718.1 Sh3 domain-containing protein [Neofusicoccum parvum]
MAGRFLASMFVLSIVDLSRGQYTYNETTGAYTCSTASGAYCGGSSLSTNIIIRCTNFVGQPGNCNDNLAGIKPVGVKPAASCYQTSATSGDAVCSFNGVGYPENDSAAAFPICNARGSRDTLEHEINDHDYGGGHGLNFNGYR